MAPPLATRADPTRLFAFEALDLGRKTQRTNEEAERELVVLFARLGVSEEQAAQLDPELRHLLLSFCIEVPSNIRWYEEARTRADRALRIGRVWVVLAVIAAVGGLAGIVVLNDQIVAAQIGMLLGSLLVILQVIAGVSDKKAQVGAFWKASSDLKEGLYTFVHAWENRVMSEGVVSPGLETALWEQIKSARTITRAERDAYFKTFKSPTEIVSVAASSFEALRGQGREVAMLQAQETQSQTSKTEASSRRLDAAQAAVFEAKARVSSAEATLAGLQAIGASEAELKEAKTALVGARSEVVRTSEMLEMVSQRDRRGTS